MTSLTDNRILVLKKKLRSVRARLGAATKKMKRFKSVTDWAVSSSVVGVKVEERDKDGAVIVTNSITAHNAEMFGKALIAKAVEHRVLTKRASGAIKNHEKETAQDL